MKILFDEGVPRQLRSLLAPWTISLVEELGWKGIKNGRLLELAEKDGFEVLITANQQLKYQQNLSNRKLAIVILPYNRRRWMALLVPQIVATLETIRLGDFIEIPMPRELS